jgi:hypothetical protein
MPLRVYVPFPSGLEADKAAPETNGVWVLASLGQPMNRHRGLAQRGLALLQAGQTIPAPLGRPFDDRFHVGTVGAPAAEIDVAEVKFDGLVLLHWNPSLTHLSGARWSGAHSA